MTSLATVYSLYKTEIPIGAVVILNMVNKTLTAVETNRQHVAKVLSIRSQEGSLPIQHNPLRIIN